jgi:hypothetical protein
VVDRIREAVVEPWALFGGLWWDVVCVRSWQARGGAAVGDNRERREPTGMRKTELVSRFQLPRHAQVMSW